MKKNILGIDLRGNAVKVVEISKSSKGIVLEKWEETHLTPKTAADRDNEQTKALKDIMSKRLIRTKKAVVIISGGDVLVKRISLPQMPNTELIQAVKLQVEKLISYPIEDVIYSYYRIANLLTSENNASEESNQSINYVLVIANKETILKTMNICKKARIRVASISTTPVALQAAFSDLLTPGICSIINMGQNSITISIYRDKEFVFNRDIGIGGDTITQAMVGTVSSPKGRLELKLEDAEQLKRKEGIPFDIDEYSARVGIPGAELYAMIRPAIEKIEAEILRSFEYFGAPAGKIILTGGSSEIRGLTEILSNALKINFEKGKTNIITRHPNISMSPYSIAIGAAIEEGKKINLMTEEDRHPLTDFIRKASNFWTAGIACAIIFVSLYMWFSYKNIIITKELFAVNAEAQSLGINLSGDESSPKDIYAFLDKFNSPGQKDILIRIIDELGKILPENVSLNVIRYDSSTRIIILNGLFKRTKNSDNITSLMNDLKKSSLFSAIDLSSLRESSASRSDGYQFEIKCTIAGVFIK